MSTISLPPVSTREDTSVGLTNTRLRYGRVAQAFHWTVALLFLAQYPIGIVAHELPLSPDWIDTKVWLFSLHKTLGVVVLVLALARIGWALLNPHPRLLNAERRGEAFAASAIHWLLYTAILLVPLTGLAIHWTTEGFAPVWLPLPEHIGLPVTERAGAIATIMHKAATITVLGAIALHIGGALKHHFVDRDATLRRMLPVAPPRLGAVPPPSMQPSQSRTALAGAGGLLVVVVLAFGIGAVWTAPAADDGTLAAESAPATVDAAPAATVAEAGAPRWTVVPDTSTLSIEVTQLGSPVGGTFDAFDADIRFDPDALDGSSVDVSIDLTSLTLGSVTEQALGLLGATETPTARFRADAFEKTADGYLARGTLALAGTEAPVELPFTLQIDGDTARMRGTASLNRTDWAVGAEQYPDEGSLGFGVDVSVEIEAVRANAGS